jgi:phage antirepressor YoqD-like protein
MSSLIISTSSQKTMTSREIADLVESRHDHVKTSIERLVAGGLISQPATRDVKNSNNQTVLEYVICQRDTYVIVAQLSPAFTARLVDRWQELEAQAVAPAFNVPTSLSSALRLAAEQAETIETQAIQLQAAKPAIEFVEKFVDSTGTKGFRQVCKLLNANEAKFRAFLSARQIMYQLGGDWVPYAHHIESGRMVVKAGAADSGHAFNSARFTTKGIEWVAGEFAKFNLHEVVAA